MLAGPSEGHSGPGPAERQACALPAPDRRPRPSAGRGRRHQEAGGGRGPGRCHVGARSTPGGPAAPAESQQYPERRRYGLFLVPPSGTYTTRTGHACVAYCMVQCLCGHPLMPATVLHKIGWALNASEPSSTAFDNQSLCAHCGALAPTCAWQARHICRDPTFVERRGALPLTSP